MFWESFADSLVEETGFYVGSNLEEVSAIVSITDAIENITDTYSHSLIDFPHMIAVIDIIYTDMEMPDHLERYSDLLFTWGGDLGTFLLDMNGVGEASNDAYKVLYDFAYNNIGQATPSYFSEEDYLADIDGVNIGRLLLEEQMLLSEALAQYYTMGYVMTRHEDFVLSYGGVEAFDATVRCIMLGELPYPYKSDDDFLEQMASISGLQAVMLRMQDQSVEPSRLARRAATEALINLVTDNIR